MADCRLDAAELVEVMADVNDVEAAPLIGTEGSEDKVGGDTLGAEAVAAGADEGIHLLDLLAEKVGELGAVHGRPVELVGAGKDGRRGAARHAPEGEDDELQEPLDGGAVASGGTAALEALLKDAAGAAAGEDEVLDEVLSAPEALVLEGMKLTPGGGLIGQFNAVRVENLLQDRVHRKARERGESVWGNYIIGGDQEEGSASISFRALRTSLARGPLGRALR